MEAAGDVVRLQVPAAADHLGTARLFGAAAGRRFGADENVVEDLRLAVSEACTIALQASRGAQSVVVTVGPVPGGLGAEVRTDTGRAPSEEEESAGPLGGAEPADGWGTELLQAMVSGLTLEPGPDGQIIVSFVLPLASEEEAAHAFGQDGA
jgi:anti-sigma regulatory factor (Ser/Thr protein kinase)